MKKINIRIISFFLILFSTSVLNSSSVFADQKEITISGKTLDLGEKDKYELSIANEVPETAERFILSGDIDSLTTKNGFDSYAVKNDNLKILINTDYGKDLYAQTDSTKWHIIEDKAKTVDGTELSEKIKTGAIIVQTSKDGRTWINSATETDIFNKYDTINNRTVNGESLGAFYKATNVQLANGCFYRIIVAYKIQQEKNPTIVLGKKIKKNYIEAERMEVYQFHAYDPSVNKSEELNTKDPHVYEFKDVYRVDSQDGFADPEMLKSDDPHIDWSVGKFYVSGYTDVKMDNEVPVFLKVPGDRAALWFNLEQELDKCNNSVDIKVNNTESGSDIYFGTPTIDNFGRGVLIVRKSIKNNQKERQIYTNYLEASATVGTNTRVDLFEEGDYEVALDYQLHYDKPAVFGTKFAKTLSYRIFFKFKVRNGDISAFLRDVDTNQFITNANVAEHGFYIDVANSQYLKMTIKREVLTNGLDGLVEDTKFSAVATEGRPYTDEGIYTVTIHNDATGDDVEKRVYVGSRDIILAHMKTGIPLSEINERIAAGAYIDENWQIVDPEPEVEEIPDAVGEDTEGTEKSKDQSGHDKPKSNEKNVTKKQEASHPQAPDKESVKNTLDEKDGSSKAFVIIPIAIVLCIAGFVMFKRKKTYNSVESVKEDTKKETSKDEEGNV